MVPDETDLLPGPEPVVPYRYGWAELLFAYIYQEEVPVRDNFPVQRNVDGRRWEKYFICQAVGDEGVTSGHYRAYLPAWAGAPRLGPGGRWPEDFRIDPRHSGVRENIRLKLPLIGDANEFSERGDGVGIDDCSYIDAGEANIAGSDGHINGNRFSDRHSGGTNYLFADLHAAWSVRLRDELARDFDLNGVDDVDVAP